MASLIAVIKDEQGKFYQKGVEYRGRRAVAFKVGDVLQTKSGQVFKAHEITQYTIVARVSGKQKRIASFPAFDDAVVALQNFELKNDFEKHAEPVVEIAATVTPSVSVGTWAALQTEYLDGLRYAVKMQTLQPASQRRYVLGATTFDTFLAGRGITLLSAITPKVIRDFAEQRVDAGRNHTGVWTDLKILKTIFALAVKNGMVAVNPVEVEAPQDTEQEAEERGAQPFTAAELMAMMKVTGEDGLMFWLLLQTGMRRSDIGGLKWGAINGGIKRYTPKNRKTVYLPILPQLQAALEAERAQRYGTADPASYANDFVLPNPRGGASVGQRVYERTVALGKRAGITNATPHRFRDTFVIDAHMRGCSIEDIARFIGDNVATVIKYYFKDTDDQREHRNAKLLAGTGLLATVAS